MTKTVVKRFPVAAADSASAADPLILYVLVRADLSTMGRGKALAQSCHVGSLFSEHHMFAPLLSGGISSVDDDVLAWRDSENTPDAPLGFGVVLTLDVPNLTTMEAITGAASALGFKSAILTDPTYPVVVPNEIAGRMDRARFTKDPAPVGPTDTVCFFREDTMAYIFGRKSKLEVLLSRFKLVPND